MLTSLEQNQYPVAKNRAFISGRRSTRKAAQAHIWTMLYPLFYAGPCSLQTVHSQGRSFTCSVKPACHQLHPQSPQRGSSALRKPCRPACSVYHVLQLLHPARIYMVKDCLHAEGENSTSSSSDLFGPPPCTSDTEFLTQRRSQPACQEKWHCSFEPFVGGRSEGKGSKETGLLEAIKLQKFQRILSLILFRGKFESVCNKDVRYEVLQVPHAAVSFSRPSRTPVEYEGWCIP